MAARRGMRLGPPWLLPVLLAVVVAAIVLGVVFGSRIRSAFEAPTATPRPTQAPQSTPTPRPKGPTPGPGTKIRGGSTPLPSMTPVPTVPGLILGMITRPAHDVQTIQRQAAA